MKNKVISVALLLCLIICIFCGCGANDVFTVDYVAEAGILNAAMIIVGQYQGETVKMDAGSFKDCTITDVQFAAGEDVVLSGTEEGYLKIEGGIILTMTDADGASHTVEVKEGSEFKLDTSDENAWRSLLPD